MTARVGHGIKFRDETMGYEQDFRLVPSGEGDVAHGLLAADSPVARALLGHAPGDTVEVKVPSGSRRLVITSVAA